jgi:hypothetical protein
MLEREPPLAAGGWKPKSPENRRTLVKGDWGDAGTRKSYRKINKSAESTLSRTGKMKGAALLRVSVELTFGNHLEMSETFAEVRASRNIIETVSFSQRNHVHVNVCAPVELAPSQKATNAWRVLLMQSGPLP